MVRSSGLIENELAPMPLIVKSDGLIVDGSIGSEYVSVNWVGAVPVTIEFRAGVSETTPGPFSNWAR